MRKLLKKIPLPGYRNIKTALAIFICGIIYAYLENDGIILAVSAALICVQPSVSRSIFIGYQRLLGTAIGGLCGIIFVVIMENYHLNKYLFVFLVALVVLFLIYLLNIINKNDSIIISCFVFLVIALDRAIDQPLLYSLQRILSTFVGVIVAVGVNTLFFRPSHDRIEFRKAKDFGMFNYKVKRYSGAKVDSWSGGLASELFVFPSRSSLIDRNFKVRLSISTVDYMETTFSVLKHYMRHMFVVKGNVKLVQDGKMVALKKNDIYQFNAEVETKCVGISEDINLIVSKDYEGKLERYRNLEEYVVRNYNLYNEYFETKIISSLYDGVRLEFDVLEREKIEINLDKNDIFILENINLADDSYTITVNKDDLEMGEVICVAGSVRKKT